MKALNWLLVLVLASTASAAGYLKIGDIKGESTDSGHKEWIDVLSVSGLETVVAPRDAASGLPTGRRTYEPVRIMKRIDKSTPLLAKRIASATPIPSMQLSFGGATYDLKNVIIVGHKVNGPNEELTLNYEEIKVTYTKANPALSAPAAAPVKSRAVLKKE